jgi:hypothetical protein
VGYLSVSSVGYSLGSFPLSYVAHLLLLVSVLVGLDDDNFGRLDSLLLLYLSLS